MMNLAMKKMRMKINNSISGRVMSFASIVVVSVLQVYLYPAMCKSIVFSCKSQSGVGEIVDLSDNKVYIEFVTDLGVEMLITRNKDDSYVSSIKKGDVVKLRYDEGGNSVDVIGFRDIDKTPILLDVILFLLTLGAQISWILVLFNKMDERKVILSFKSFRPSS
jgi:hypothetical protein